MTPVAGYPRRAAQARAQPKQVFVDKDHKATEE